MTSTAFCLACSSVKKVVEEVKGLFLSLLYYYDQFDNVCFIIKLSDQEGSQTYIPYIAVKSFTTLLIFLSRYSLSSFRSKS